MIILVPELRNQSTTDQKLFAYEILIIIRKSLIEERRLIWDGGPPYYLKSNALFWQKQIAISLWKHWRKYCDCLGKEGEWMGGEGIRIVTRFLKVGSLPDLRICQETIKILHRVANSENRTRYLPSTSQSLCALYLTRSTHKWHYIIRKWLGIRI